MVLDAGRPLQAGVGVHAKGAGLRQGEGDIVHGKAAGKQKGVVEFEPVGIMEQINITTYRNILYYQLLLDEVRGAIENGPLTLAV